MTPSPAADPDARVAFLIARYDEIEKRIRTGGYQSRSHDGRELPTGTVHTDRCGQIGCLDPRCMCGTTACDCGELDRILADLDAKRAILAETLPAIRAFEERIEGEWGSGNPSRADREASDGLLGLLIAPFVQVAPGVPARLEHRVTDEPIAPRFEEGDRVTDVASSDIGTVEGVVRMITGAGFQRCYLVRWDGETDPAESVVRADALRAAN